MKKVLILCFIFFLGVNLAYSQMGIPKAQAMFIFNFSRLTEWPASYRTGPFIIGVIGTSPVADELEIYTKGKKVGIQDIQINRFKTVQEINNCHIVFIPFARSKQMGEIVATLEGKSTLIITEKGGSLNDGAAINFIILEDKLKFELKAENASKFGIKVSSKLEEMAMAGG
jgi:hypothetical protein